MEMLNKISVAIFDKTGTLTEGRPQVTDFIQLKEIAAIAHLSAAVVASISENNNLQQRNTLIKNSDAKS
jgi:P-type E1-E2 ATPase